jgi:predicted lipoprotein
MNRRPLLALALPLLLGILLWRVPLFHIIPLRQTQQQQRNAALDATAFARDFWKDKLLPATDQATPVSELWKALASDPVAARKEFGHSPGMSSVAYFLVQGSGKVTKTEKDIVQLSLDTTNPPIIELSAGLIFGNAIRDSSGSLNGSDFPNSQDFNDISTELNHIVETEVIPSLRQKAQLGKRVRFAGALEIEEGEIPKIPLVTPIKVDLE